MNFTINFIIIEYISHQVEAKLSSLTKKCFKAFDCYCNKYDFV